MMGIIASMKICRRIVISILLTVQLIVGGGCVVEKDEAPSITGGNPPTIQLHLAGPSGPVYINGPYTLEQLKQANKITNGKNELTSAEKAELKNIFGDKNYDVWTLNSTGASASSITYGSVPEGYKQIYPATGPPQPLIEGMIYSVHHAPHYGTYPKFTYFMINNDKVRMITEDQLRYK